MQTTLEDGRIVQANECAELESALFGPDDVPEIQEQNIHSFLTLSDQKRYYIVCRCCDGCGTHSWGPSSSFNGASSPDDGEYGCASCAGEGEFKVVTP